MRAASVKRGPGNFQWNTGGWFGGQLGGTVWLIVAASVFAAGAPRLALALAACWLGANAIGTWLWWRRDRLLPYPAVQLMLVVVGAFSSLALFAIDYSGHLSDFDRYYRETFPHWLYEAFRQEPRWLYAGLLVFPCLMVAFRYIERTAISRARGLISR